eukprot:1179966-Prorocentrum_minimum.AAC.2
MRAPLSICWACPSKTERKAETARIAWKVEREGVTQGEGGGGGQQELDERQRQHGRQGQRQQGRQQRQPQ